jgi:hypothetical protein
MTNPDSTNRIIRIKLRHFDNHVPYYDVEMPSEAAAMIRKNLEWSTPVSLVPKVQAAYPSVTGNQIHAAWTGMSETLWKRDQYQLLSAKMLLKEYTKDVDLFDVPTVNGVEQLCWGMKKIMGPLRGKVVEIGIDATCAYPLCFCKHRVSAD